MTNVSLLCDIPAWTFYIAAGCLGVVWIGAGLMIVLVEAVVLRLLQWGTFGRSLLDAFLMNLASTLIGCAVPIILLATDNVPGVLLGLVGGWALSVGIEGGVLALINANRKTERRPARQIWLASLLANAASYVMLAVFISMELIINS